MTKLERLAQLDAALGWIEQSTYPPVHTLHMAMLVIGEELRRQMSEAITEEAQYAR